MKNEPTLDELRTMAEEAFLEVWKKDVEENPAAVLEDLTSILRNGLANLRLLLEDENEAGITWGSPFVELLVPADELPVEALTEEELRSFGTEEADRTVEKLAEVYHAARRTAVLQSLADLAKRRGLEAFTIGGYASKEEPSEGDRIAQALTESPRLPIVGQRTLEDGTVEEIRADVFASFFPLEEHEAGEVFPVVVGLVFLEGDPRDWSEEELVSFWEKLDQAFAEEETTKGAKAREGARESDSANYRTQAPRPGRPLPWPPGGAVFDPKSAWIARGLGKIRLPARRWSSIPRLEELKREEVRRIQDEEGDRAFEDLKRTTGDKNARGALLKRRFSKDGEVVSLTSAAERQLKERAGLATGYRAVDVKTGKEFLYRTARVGGGFYEIGLSWEGMAGPLVEDWRQKARQEAAEAQRQGVLFDDLDRETRERIDRQLSRLQLFEPAQELMELLRAACGHYGTNRVRIPAAVCRHILDLEKDKDWKAKLEACLSTLLHLSYRYESHQTGKKEKGEGNFIGEWKYYGAGAGGLHGRGDYEVLIMPPFLGCLDVFTKGKTKLSSGLELVQYDFQKKLTKDEKEAQGWRTSKRDTRARNTSRGIYTRAPAWRPLFNKAANFTPEQRTLVDFLERNFTRNKHASKTKGRRSKSTDANSADFRVYTSKDFPALPDGRGFYGALGQFERNPETGWRLSAIAKNLRRTLPRGAGREAALRELLEDFRTVVVEWWKGRVLIRTAAGTWLDLEDAAQLPADDLGNKTLFFPFAPDNVHQLEADQFAKIQRARHARGETREAWEVPKDMDEYQRARLEERGESLGPDGLPLRMRLRITRKKRGLPLQYVADFLGVSKPLVSMWERGTDPNEEGKVRGKPIPDWAVPLLTRWIETGEEPQENELRAAREGEG